MKTYTYALLLAAAATGMAFGQTAYTTPVGYTTQALAPNTYNLVGLTVQRPALVAGTISGVAGAVISDAEVNFTTALPAGRTYILEITSGTAAGTVQEFVTYAGSDITLPAAIAGIAATNTYAVRVAPTLEELFTTTAPGNSITAAFTSAGADIIWVPNGAGSYDKYFFDLPGPVVRNLSDVATPNVPVAYVDGLFIQKKGTATSLTVSGEVKKTGSNAIAVGGATVPVSIVAPVGLTLNTSGLADDLTAAFTAAGADIVWVPTGTGTYNKYGLRLPAPAVWQKLNASGNFDGVTLVDFELPSSILIQRKGASKLVTLNVPAAFSNL